MKYMQLFLLLLVFMFGLLVGQWWLGAPSSNEEQQDVPPEELMVLKEDSQRMSEVRALLEKTRQENLSSAELLKMILVAIGVKSLPVVAVDGAECHTEATVQKSPSLAASTDAGSLKSENEATPTLNLDSTQSEEDAAQAGVPAERPRPVYTLNPQKIPLIDRRDLLRIGKDFNLEERVDGEYEGVSKITFKDKAWKDRVKLSLKLQMKNANVWGTLRFTVNYRSNGKKGQTALTLSGNTLKGWYVKTADLIFIEFETSSLQWFENKYSRLLLTFPPRDSRRTLQLFRFNGEQKAYENVGWLMTFE